LLANLKSTLVTVEDPIPPINHVSQVPIEPLLLQLDSLGNVIEEECPRLLSRPYTETQTKHTQQDYNDEHTPHVQYVGMVNPQQTLVRSIWRTPSGRDLYEKINFSRPPLDPLTYAGAETRPSGQTIDRPIEKVVNPVASSVQVQSNIGVVILSHTQGTLMVTPTTPPLQPTTSYVPQNLVGTPIHHGM
jgi:hypothetical protein